MTIDELKALRESMRGTVCRQLAPEILALVGAAMEAKRSGDVNAMVDELDAFNTKLESL